MVVPIKRVMPCECCGSDDVGIFGRMDAYVVQCKSCGTSTDEYPTIDEAVESWSDRNA